ncbi:MAG: hypothetical protein K5839_04135 [Treponemataceae bacterium]|nr:hypothetical protein [Treponemataceae bacterium]
MKKIVILLAAALLASVFSGCASMETEELGRFTIISSKNVDLSRLGQMQRSSGKVATQKFNAKGAFIKDEKLSDNYQLENALDSALEQIPGAVAMVDAKVEYFHSKSFGKEQWGYKMEGTALVDPSLVGENSKMPENGTIYFVADGTNGKVTLLSEAEYEEFIAKIEG